MSAIQVITDDENFIIKLKNSLIPELQEFTLQLSKNFQPKEATKYLTRNEVCEMLNIDLSTLHRWRKENVIVAYGIQNRVYFKRFEVEELINKNRLK